MLRSDTPNRGTQAPARRSDKQAHRLVAAVQRLWLRGESAGRLHAHAGQDEDRLVDVLTATPGGPKLPDAVFSKLRWGGLFLYVASNEKRVRNLAAASDGKRGFVLEPPATTVHCPTIGPPFPGLAPPGPPFPPPTPFPIGLPHRQRTPRAEHSVLKRPPAEHPTEQ